MISYIAEIQGVIKANKDIFAKFTGSYALRHNLKLYLIEKKKIAK